MIPTLRSTPLCIGVVCVLGAAVLGGLAWWYAPPGVDQAQAQAVQPVIDAYMHQNGRQLDFGGLMDPRLKPAVFCDATIIEIRTRGPHWRVGMKLGCGEYARRDSILLEAFQGGDFDVIADVMTSGHGGRLRVLSLDLGPDAYPGYPAWVHENYSSRAARWLLSDDSPIVPDPIGQARRAFGFPADYPAVQDW